VSGEPAIPGGAFAVFPGGSLYLVVGVLAALRHTAATGEGQNDDAAVIDGLAHLHSLDVARDQAWQATQDSSSLHAVGPNTPFYATYRTADGRYMSVAAVEPKFYARLIEVLGLRDVPDRADQRNWDAIRTQIGTRFAQRTQRAWTDEFAELDACVTPVLKLHEAAQHPHVVARGTFVKVAGRPQPAPAPRFSATPTAPLSEVRAFEQDFGAVLAMWSTETRKSTRA
jgi:alpha-methylacyl-CoA racemase